MFRLRTATVRFCYALHLQLGFMLSAVLIPAVLPGHPCASCHPKEVEGYAQTAMAHSMGAAGPQPEGSFEHSFSGTRFSIRNTASGVLQTLERPGESQTLRVEYVIGSGSHAFGYLAELGDHLFQSPIAYYTNRKQWDVAPGYEQSSKPDFSRPVTVECVACHSDKPLPLADTLNGYQSPPFAQGGIQCDRCHGPAEEHLKRPVPGSIINPAKLAGAARDSICEQCHLTGEARIPNPGKSVLDFRPGQRLEDVFTVYVVHQTPGKTIKVISQAEQLALSACVRNSGGKLWCGTCHNPHETPARPAEYFRERCLTCHGATLDAAHGAPTHDCIGCHMPRRPAKDGGHTAFTDHRITRYPAVEGEPIQQLTPPADLIAWREPDEPLRQRNLALALVTVGMENHDSNQVIRGYRMLNRLEKDFSNDPAFLTALGTIILRGKQPAEAERRFGEVLRLRPNYAPYQVNEASALLEAGKTAEATQHLERAVQLDPLLQQAVQLLSNIYRMQDQRSKADDLMARYRQAMGITLQ
jgi:hypothetical protein